MKKNLVTLLTKIKNASLARKKILKTKNIKYLTKYVNSLYTHGLIQSYFFQIEANVEYLYIFLRNFYSKIITTNLKILSKPSRVMTLSYSDLTRLHIKNKTFFLSTSKGILSHTKCLEYKLGGIALFSC